MNSVLLEGALGLTSEHAHRLVFRGLARNARIKDLLPQFMRQLRLQAGEMKLFLSTPPRALWALPDLSRARAAQRELAELGCVTTLEEVLVDQALPCPLPIPAVESLRGKLGADSSRHAAVAWVESDSDEGIHALLKLDVGAMVSRIGHDQQGWLLDCRHLLLVASADPRDGVVALRYRLQQALPRYLGDPSRWRMGLSIHPVDGESVVELLATAARRARGEDAAVSADAPTGDAQAPADFEQLAPDRRALEFARGAALGQLLNMPAEELRAVLAASPEETASAFRDRVWLGHPRAADCGAAPVPDAQAAARAQTRLAAIGEAPRFLADLRRRLRTRARLQADLEKVEALPALPNIVTQLIQKASSSDSTAEALTALIEQDPGLAAKLLALVNSAFFGFKREITDIKHAVVILGADEVTKLATTLASARLFRVESGYGSGVLWTHATIVAALARELATQAECCDPGTAYTAGLLHDIGRIHLLRQLPGEYAELSQLAQQARVPLFELEAERLGLDHAEAGLEIARAWNLPDALSQAIGGHHHPAPGTPAADLAAIIGLADQVHRISEHPETDIQLTAAHRRILGRRFGDLDAGTLPLLADEYAPLIEQAARLAAS